MSIALNRVGVLGPGSAAGWSRRFAIGIACAMLAVNLIGFGPTLYLRPFFDPPPIPLYLYIHGIVGTAWFVLVVAQVLLVTNRRFRQHRLLGWFGVLLAVAIVLIGVYTSTNMVPRNAALGNVSEEEIRLYALVTSADLTAFIVIPSFVALAIVLRRRTDIHMRLLLLATLGMLGPAIARIASWFGEIPNPVLIAIQLVFFVSFLAHDYATRRRPHAATIFGIVFIVGVNVGLRVSGIGMDLVLRRLAEA